MANTKKIEESKKDMNFFSEFGGAGGQVSSYMSLILIIFIGFLVIAGAIYAVFFIQAMSVRAQIKSLEAKMSEESYVQALNEHKAISNEIQNLNKEYYELTYLYSEVESKDKLQSTYMDIVTKNLPSDICLTSLLYKDGALVLSGTSMSYYSPLDYLNALSKEEIFSKTEINEITQVQSKKGTSDYEYLFVSKYNFSIVCKISESYIVRLYRLVDDINAQPIGAIETSVFKLGDIYSKSGIFSYTTADGVPYVLSRISINNLELSAEELEQAIANDSLSKSISVDTNVRLYYKLQVEVAS